MTHEAPLKANIIFSLYVVSFANSILLTPEYSLYLLITGENWNGFMYNLNSRNSAPDCDPNPDPHPEDFNWYEFHDEREIVI